MLRLVLPALLAASLLLTPTARADVGDDEQFYDPGPAVRRSGFAGGLTLATMFGSVAGYPNDLSKLDVPGNRGATGLAGGTGGGLWVGTAMRDFLVLGLGVSFGSVAGSSARLSNGGAFVVHVEAFPLFQRGGHFRDLAIVGDFGAGPRDVWRGSEQRADGGLTSYLGLGVLYEPIRIGRHVSAGPVLQVAYQFSPSLTATLVTAGIQVAYYGGPG